MDIRDLKEEILNRDLLIDILSEIGCHHVQDRGDYIQCGNKDGDNTKSIVVYKKIIYNSVCKTQRQGHWKVFGLLTESQLSMLPMESCWWCRYHK